MIEFDDLPAAACLRIDQLCDEYETSQRLGKRPRIEDYLPQVENALQPALLKQLLYLELEPRHEQTDPPGRDELCARFPAHEGIVDAVFSHGESDTPALSGYQDDTPGTVGVGGDAKVGDVVGYYEMIEQLGRGGMGTVYRAVHRTARYERALKLIHPKFSGEPSVMRRFLREGQAAMKLKHQNIVEIHEVGQHGESMHLVLELLQGEDLARRVERAGALPFDEAASIIEQTAVGLAFAHQHDYVHRDIKPHNIFLTDEGVPKILDLGLVRAFDDPEPLGGKTDELPDGLLESRLTVEHALGTPAYMPPEQSENPRNVDARSDIYALGCTFYFLLTGKNAFAGESSEEVRQRHAAGDFPHPRELRPAIPESLEAVLYRMLQRQPEERFQTADEVVAALRFWRLCRPETERIFRRPSDDSLAQRLYFRLWLLLLAGLLPNLLASLFFNGVYRNIQFLEIPKPSPTVNWAIIGATYLLGFAWAVYLVGPIVWAIRSVQWQKPAAARTIEAGRHGCLDAGRGIATCGVVMWVLGGICYALALGERAASLHFILGQVICGLFVAAYSFFLMTATTVRAAYPMLFQQGPPGETEIRKMERLSQSTVIYTGLAMLIPAIAAVALVAFLSRQGQLTSQDQRSVFLLASILILSMPVGGSLILFLNRLIQRGLAVFLRIAQSGDGEASRVV